jgi:predicted RNase H-like HicB family nuclease
MQYLVVVEETEGKFSAFVPGLLCCVATASTPYET